MRLLRRVSLVLITSLFYKGLQPRKIDFDNQMIKCTRDFGQLEFLTAPHCSDITVSEIPCLRTMDFYKTPQFGQEDAKRFPGRKAPILRQMVQRNPKFRTPGFVNPFLRTERLPPIQLSITIRPANWREGHGQERIH